MRGFLRCGLIAGGLLWMAGLAIAKEPPAGTTIQFPKDGAEMVYVPAGEFIMGLDAPDLVKLGQDLVQNPPDKMWAWEAFPRHKVNLPGYFIDKYEVTVGRWQRFVNDSGFKGTHNEIAQHFTKPDEQLLPVGEVKWSQAKEYCKWAGKALPTEEQWEKAARGTDGRLYPWGNDPPTPEHGHFGPKPEEGKPWKMPNLYVNVGNFPKGKSPYGCYDMLGNQYEWTASYNAPYANNPEVAKMKGYGKMPALRGGSWYHGWVGFYSSKRFGLEPDETYYHIGFRTIWTPPAGYFESPAFQQQKQLARARPERVDRLDPK